MAAVTNTASGGGSASKTKSKSSKGKLLNLGELLKDYSSVNWAEEMEKETKLSASLTGTTNVTTIDQRVNIVATRSALPTAPKAARGDTDGQDNRGPWQHSYDQRRDYDSGGGYSQRYGRDQQQRPSYGRGGYNNRGGGPGGYERSAPLPPPQSDRGAPYQAHYQPERSAPYQSDRGTAYGHTFQQNSEYKPEYDSGTFPRRHDRDRPPMHRSGYNRGAGTNYDVMPPSDYRNTYAPPYPHNNYEYRHDHDGPNYPPPQRMSSREPPQQRYYDENRMGGNFNRRSQPPPDHFAGGPPPQQRYGSLRRVSHRVSTTSSADDQRSEDMEAPKTRPHLQLLPRTKPLPDERVVVPPPPADAPSKVTIFGDAKPVDTRLREQEVEERYLRAKQEVLSTEKKQPAVSEIHHHAEKPHHYNAPHQRFIPPRQQRTLSGSSARSSPIEDPRPSQQNTHQHYQRPPEDPMTRSEISVRTSTDEDPKLQLGHVTIMRRSTTEKTEEKIEEQEVEKSSDVELKSVEVAVTTAKLEKSVTMPNVSDHARSQEAQNEMADENESHDVGARRRSEIEVTFSKQRRDSTSSFKSGGSRGGGNINYRNRGPLTRSRDDSDAGSQGFRHGSRVFTRGGGYQNYDSTDRFISPARSTASYNNANAWGQRGGASRGRGRGSGGGSRFQDRSRDRRGSGDARRNYNRQQPSDREETVDADGFKKPHPRHDKRYSNTRQQRSNIGQKESSAPPALNENSAEATAIAVSENSSPPISQRESATPSSSNKIKEEKMLSLPSTTPSSAATVKSNIVVKAATDIKEAKAAAATVVTAAAAAAAAAKPPPSSSSSSRKSGQQKKKSNDKKKTENDKSSTSFTATNKYQILGDLQD